MSTEETLIESPEALKTFIAQNPSAKDHIRIKILQPLSSKENLDPCRNFDSRYSKNSEGERCGLTEHEYLNMTPLSKAWRQHWKEMPTTITKVTFDLAIPKPDEGVEQIYWNDMSPNRSGVKIHMDPRGITSLVNTLVLELHMRSKGSVKFRLECADSRMRRNGKGEKLYEEPRELLMMKGFIEGLGTMGKSNEERIAKKKAKREEAESGGN